MPAHVPTIESCEAPATRKLLLAYGMRRATKPEQETFERHVRSCAKCSDDLVAMWRVAELIDDWMRRPDDAPAGVAALVRARRRRRVVLVATALVAAAAAGYLLKTAL
jgi:hypothetical protein